MHDDDVFYAIFSCKTPQKSCAQRHRAVNFALMTIFNTFSGVRVLLSRVLKTAAAMALSTTLIAPAAAQSDQFALPAPAADSFSKAQNLRDHMSEAELIFTALAELSTRQIAETMEATGMKENEVAGKKGGGIARKARVELEEKTGRSVVTGENFLPPGRKKISD